MMKPVQLLQFSLNCSRDVSSSLFGRGAVQPFHWIRSGREMMPERTDLGGSRMAARGTWKGLELAVLPLSDVAGRRRSTEFRTYPPNEDCRKVFVRIILFLLAPTAKGRGKQYRTESPIRSSHPACMHACIRRARGGFRSSVSRSSGEEYDLNSSGRRLNSPASRRRTAHVVRSRSVGGIQGSNRMEKRTSDEQEADDETKKLVAKVDWRGDCLGYLQRSDSLLHCSLFCNEGDAEEVASSMKSEDEEEAFELLEKYDEDTDLISSSTMVPRPPCGIKEASILDYDDASRLSCFIPQGFPPPDHALSPVRLAPSSRVYPKIF
ncbi:hypothetical protein BHE74_00025695 [Ensete ventricosum]|nr:hypothetical protein BHE74_00025695 [Ensete ventricosum]RZR92125.1 hypothetical protein BHM03_00020378 [Ensete ventricosum]